jgi:hypothetical protein
MTIPISWVELISEHTLNFGVEGGEAVSLCASAAVDC